MALQVFDDLFKLGLDRAVPLHPTSGVSYRRFSDLMTDMRNAAIPNEAVVYGCMVTKAAAGGAAVDVAPGFVRKADGTVAEVVPTVTIATAAPVTAGHAIIYNIIVTESTGVASAVAGSDTTAANAVAPALAAGTTLLATVKMLTGDATPQQANIKNIARTIPA